jgi:gluconolactonase
MVTARGLESLVDPGAEMTRLASGFDFTEGPVWVSAEQRLLFSDIPGDARWAWQPGSGLSLVARPTCKGNGMCLDVNGDLIVCEHVSSSVTRVKNGTREVLAFHYGGKYLNSPNDAATRTADGSIYFTDPAVGRLDEWVGLIRPRELQFQGVYRIPPNRSEIELVVDEHEFETPNGLCFSPEQEILYINDTTAGQIKAFTVLPDGPLSDARLVHEHKGLGWPHEGNFDGMECDNAGNIWVTGPGGVWVIEPSGKRLGILETPEICGSLSWGGDDLRTLFLMTSTSVHMTRTLIGPAPLPGSQRPSL